MINKNISLKTKLLNLIREVFKIPFFENTLRKILSKMIWIVACIKHLYSKVMKILLRSGFLFLQMLNQVLDTIESIATRTMGSVNLHIASMVFPI